MKKKFLFFIVATALIMCSCKKDVNEDPQINDNPQIQGLTDFPKIGPDSTTAMFVPSASYRIDIDLNAAHVSDNFSWVGLAYEMGKKIGDKLKDKISSSAVDYVWNRLFPTESDRGTYVLMDSLLNRVNEMSRQLDDITNQLAQITDLINNLHLLDAQNSYQLLRSRMITLNELNDYYFSLLQDAGSDSARFREIILEWGDSFVNGTSAHLEALSFAENMTTFFIQQEGGTRISLCSIFDMIVYNSTPWESEGYDLREQFRTTYAMVAYQSLELSYMYDLFKNSTTHANTVINKVGQVTDFFNLNAVDRKTNSRLAVCQIKGAHISFNRSNCAEITNGFELKKAEWLNSDLMLACYKLGVGGSAIDLPTQEQINSAKAKLPTSAELKAIVNYYKGTSMAKTHTLIDILEEVARMNLPNLPSSRVYFPTTGTWFDARKSWTTNPYSATPYYEVDMHDAVPAACHIKSNGTYEEYMAGWEDPAGSYTKMVYNGIDLPVGDKYREDDDGYPYYRKWKLAYDGKTQNNEYFTIAWLQIASRQ